MSQRKSIVRQLYEDEDQYSDMRRLIKGKGHATSNFKIQSPKSKHNPSQKNKRAMRRKGIRTIQHNADGIDGNDNLLFNQFQCPCTQMKWNLGFEAEGSSKAKGYKEKGIDIINPSLPQPVLVDKGTIPQENGTTNQDGPSFILMQAGTQDQQPNTLIDVIAVEIPLNTFYPSCPEEDEYMPIQSEDETIGDSKEEDEEFRGGTDEEQHCNILVTSLNGAPEKEKVPVTYGLSSKIIH